VQIVAAYFAGSAAFGPVRAQLRTPPGPGDPLYAVWAPRLPAPSTSSLTSASVPVRPDPTRAHSRSQHFRFSER
jgi:hypothetical protein